MTRHTLLKVKKEGRLLRENITLGGGGSKFSLYGVHVLIREAFKGDSWYTHKIEVRVLSKELGLARKGRHIEDAVRVMWREWTNHKMIVITALYHFRLQTLHRPLDTIAKWADQEVEKTWNPVFFKPYLEKESTKAAIAPVSSVVKMGDHCKQLLLGWNYNIHATEYLLAHTSTDTQNKPKREQRAHI